jgi:exodeoxyribonuclease V alpha subunit
VPAPAATVETREATLKRIKWERPGNAWKLLQMTNGQTWKGAVGDILPGAFLKAKGVEVTDNFGLAFEIQELVSSVLKGAAGVESWLTYRMPEIGAVRARALVERFGEDLGATILTNPTALSTVPGLTMERAAEIQKAYVSYQDELAWVPKLVDNGLTMAHALIAFNAHGVGLEKVLAEDPYALVDVEALSFEVVDALARRLGMNEKDPRRMRAWVRNLLEEDLDEGHCNRPLVEVIVAIAKWGFPAREVIDLLKPSKHLWFEEKTISLARIAYAERRVAAGVRRLLARGQREVEAVELPESLDASQRAAALALLIEPIVVMTGGPGVGKTHTLKSALDVIESRGEWPALAAPTGKAAKRMSEVTGRPASTIHKLLEWTPDGWRRGPNNAVDASVVVIDEASMVDIELAAALFDGIGEGTRLILVGDVDQLPPVGPGQPLVDVIRSAQVPVHRLTTTHRQGAKSWVVQNAPVIINGDMPDLENGEAFDFLACGSSDEIVRAVISLCRRFPNLQVLTPEHKGGAGTRRLNNEIQAVMNPESQERFADCVEANGYKIYAGDRVIYRRNQLGLVNGDQGVVENVQVMGNKSIVHVRFPGVLNPATNDDLFALKDAQTRPLMLAYAITVHASQGSEWSEVLVVADEAHWSFRRQLLYTAVTRTSDKLGIVGSREAVARAVAKPRDTNRRTRLVERIVGAT